MKFDEDELVEIANEVARILARRAPLTGAYTTNDPPPDASRRRFNELVPSVPGAVKRGRVWSVSVAAWEAFRATRGQHAVKPTVDDLARRAAVRAGYHISG